MTATAPRLLRLVEVCCNPVASAIDEGAAAELAETFKALADPARVTILSMLMNTDEVCACDVSSAIDKAAGTTSHHLKVLRAAGLVTGDKRGTWIYYRIVPERVEAIRDALTPRTA